MWKWGSKFNSQQPHGGSQPTQTDVTSILKQKNKQKQTNKQKQPKKNKCKKKKNQWLQKEFKYEMLNSTKKNVFEKI